MKNLRQLHVYLGCFFAPLLIYFTLSGSWQVFRLHDLPKNQPGTASQRFLHAFSNPHRDATLPWHDPKTETSVLFEIFAAAAALGFFALSVMGLQMAVQVKSRRKKVWLCLFAGTVIPIIFLFFHT
jgi:hypothetical protein